MEENASPHDIDCHETKYTSSWPIHWFFDKIVQSFVTAVFQSRYLTHSFGEVGIKGVEGLVGPLREIPNGNWSNFGNRPDFEPNFKGSNEFEPQHLLWRTSTLKGTGSFPLLVGIAFSKQHRPILKSHRN